MSNFSLKYMGSSHIGTKKSNMYKLQGVTIGVSLTDGFALEKTADAKGKKVKTVSFSNKNKPIPSIVLMYALRHFGIDTNKTYYVNMKPCLDPYTGEMLDIYYYEQPQDTEGEQ